MNRRHNRKVLRSLSLAALAGLYPYHNSADDKGGGGGGADEKAKDDKLKGDKGGKADDKAKEPKKVELTEEELAARVTAAVEAERKKHQADAEARKKAHEEEDARKKGEFEKLYQGEASRVKELEQEVAATKLEARRKDVAIKLSRHLAADHKDYIENDVDILPHIAFDADTKDDEIDKRIKAAAEAFVKRTPKASGLMGAPAGAARGKLPAGTVVTPKKEDERRHRPTGPVSRF